MSITLLPNAEMVKFRPHINLFYVHNVEDEFDFLSFSKLQVTVNLKILACTHIIISRAAGSAHVEVEYTHFYCWIFIRVGSTCVIIDYLLAKKIAQVLQS